MLIQRRTWVSRPPTQLRSALALGVLGLAPYCFESRASVSSSGPDEAICAPRRSGELRIPNAGFHPLVEFEVYGRLQRERQIAMGLSVFARGSRDAITSRESRNVIKHSGAESLSVHAEGSLPVSRGD